MFIRQWKKSKSIWNWKPTKIPIGWKVKYVKKFLGVTPRKLQGIRGWYVFQGSLPRKLRFQLFNFERLRDVSRQSFVFRSSTFSCSGKSRTKASFSTLQLSVFGGSLARKLHFHIFNFQFSGKSRTKCMFGRPLRFCCFFSFLAPLIFLFKILLRSLQNRTFYGSGAKIRFWSRFWAREDLRWSESELRRAEMRWAELRRAWKMWEWEDGTGMTTHELVAANHRRLADTLYAQSLFRSIGYKRFNFWNFRPRLARVLLV